MSLGRGADCAGWFNTHAKRVTAARVAKFQQALPEARVYAASTFDDARKHADELVKHLPRVLFCGGGDGTVVTLLNLLRERGVTKFPIIGLFKLGTGNGWPSAVGARRYERQVAALSLLPSELPLHHYQLIEVEGRVCQFAGVGWDATLLHDYKRNLEKRENQLVAGSVASRMSKGVGGYLYSLFRLTVPGELKRAKSPTVLKLENIGGPVKTFDAKRDRVEVPAAQKILYEGPMSIGACGVEPFWGAKFMAFPYAEAEPGRFNFRVYDRHVLTGVNNMFNLWQGRDLPGMHDWWVTRVRLHLSRPMPYQLGGDVAEQREVVDFTLAPQTVELIEWSKL